MNIINEEMSDEIRQVNETIISIQPSLPIHVTNNIYYTRLKYLMFNEIVKFCREKVELKQELLSLRTTIGDFYNESDITEIFNGLKNKFNNGDDENIGMEYHIESTRHDYGVCLFCIIKRGETIYMKKFIFRYRKGSSSQGLELSGLGSANEPLTNQIKKDIIGLGGDTNEL